jgi:hypothetical protein
MRTLDACVCPCMHVGAYMNVFVNTQARVHLCKYLGAGTESVNVLGDDTLATLNPQGIYACMYSYMHVYTQVRRELRGGDYKAARKSRGQATKVADLMPPNAPKVFVCLSLRCFCG